MKALLFVLVLGGMSCSTLQKLADTMENVGMRYDRLEKRYDSVVKTAGSAMAAVKDIAQKADKDKDGRVTLSELFAWIMSGGGLATIALLLRNGKYNERKTKMEAALAELQRNAPATPATRAAA